MQRAVVAQMAAYEEHLALTKRREAIEHKLGELLRLHEVRGAGIGMAQGRGRRWSGDGRLLLRQSLCRPGVEGGWLRGGFGMGAAQGWLGVRRSAARGSCPADRLSLRRAQFRIDLDVLDKTILLASAASCDASVVHAATEMRARATGMLRRRFLAIKGLEAAATPHDTEDLHDHQDLAGKQEFAAAIEEARSHYLQLHPDEVKLLHIHPEELERALEEARDAAVHAQHRAVLARAEDDAALL